VGSSKNDNKLRGEKAMIKENDRVKTLVEKEGFYAGESIPVNQKLSDIFLQLHISEQSGRGVPKITEVYGENAFEFRENSIVVTLLYAGYAINLLWNELFLHIMEQKRKGETPCQIKDFYKMCCASLYRWHCNPCCSLPFHGRSDHGRSAWR
jgi:hypothetical protein